MIRIGIVGNGIDAWLTAAWLAHTMPASTHSISVIPVHGSDACDDLYAVQPLTPDDTLRALGLSDLALLHDCDASFGLGGTWRDSAGAEPARVFPYGPTGLDFGGIAFHHHWRRLFPTATGQTFFAFSPGAQAMRQERFAPPVSRNAIGPLQHEVARHVAPASLRDRLRVIATDLGVAQSRAPLASRQNLAVGEPVTSLTLTNGKAVNADLYVDASGVVAALASVFPAKNWVPTDAHQPWTVRALSTSQHDAYQTGYRVSKMAEGWRWQAPLRRHTVALEFTAKSAATSGTLFSTGHLTTPWLNNVIAVGLSAARWLPLAPLQARFLNLSLTRLVNLMPGSFGGNAEAREYNHLFVRDMNAVHDLIDWHREPIPERDDMTDSLRNRVDLFSKRGWLPPTDGGFVGTDEWISAFMGHGLLANHVDPMTHRHETPDLAAKIKQLSHDIDHVVREFPALKTYLEIASTTPPRRRVTEASS
ncbi:MAG: tryptophan 7-halogenase [Gammaproteobacteria bacterium]